MRVPRGWLDVESEKLDDYADDLERAFETDIKAVEAEIKEARKALRGEKLELTSTTVVLGARLLGGIYPA